MPSMNTLYKRTAKLMGNRFEIGIVHGKESEAHKLIEAAIAEIGRIEAVFTTFRDDSLTNRINAQAGIEPVEVTQEFFDLVARSLRISALTQGAFDISYGSIDKSLWNFDLNMTALPDAQTARQAVGLINYQNIVLNADNQTVFLKQRGMRIGFGGIGKGYAADRAKQLLQAEGVQSGVINASGDLNTWGKQANGQHWTIGVANPHNPNTAIAKLKISGMAVATSGNYEKFVNIEGKRYSHTINPKTGLPTSGIKSVTILAPTAELADALATPVMVMGLGVGIGLINQIKGIACVVIDDNDKIFTSQNINIK